MMNLRVLVGFLVQKMVKVGHVPFVFVRWSPTPFIPRCDYLAPSSGEHFVAVFIGLQGLTQVIAGVVLLASFASPALGWGFTAVIGETSSLPPPPPPSLLLSRRIFHKPSNFCCCHRCRIAGAAVWVSVGELFLVSLFIRARHRIARSALGRLYGFSYDVFSSIHGVISMALQRSFAGEWLPPWSCTCNNLGIFPLSVTSALISRGAITSPTPPLQTRMATWRPPTSMQPWFWQCGWPATSSSWKRCSRPVSQVGGAALVLVLQLLSRRASSIPACHHCWMQLASCTSAVPTSWPAPSAWAPCTPCCGTRRWSSQVTLRFRRAWRASMPPMVRWMDVDTELPAAFPG